MQAQAQNQAVEILCRFNMQEMKPVVFIPRREDMAAGQISAWVSGQPSLVALDNYHRTEPLSAADEEVLKTKFMRSTGEKNVVVRHRLPRVARERANLLAKNGGTSPTASANAPALPAPAAAPVASPAPAPQQAAPVVTPAPAAIPAPQITPNAVVIPDLSADLAAADKEVAAIEEALKIATAKRDAIKKQQDALAPLIALAAEYAAQQGGTQAPADNKEAPAANTEKQHALDAALSQVANTPTAPEENQQRRAADKVEAPAAQQQAAPATNKPVRGAGGKFQSTKKQTPKVNTKRKSRAKPIEAQRA